MSKDSNSNGVLKRAAVGVSVAVLVCVNGLVRAI